MKLPGNLWRYVQIEIAILRHRELAFRHGDALGAEQSLHTGKTLVVDDARQPLVASAIGDSGCAAFGHVDLVTRRAAERPDERIEPASLTKLMTGLIISEAKLPMDEPITITQDDVDTEKGSRSRLSVGTTLTRGEMLHLALMSSENRAAHALGRTYPGGLATFVSLMNAKARMLGMTDTRYVEPTGLSSQNQASARDLATLVNVAHGDPVLRELSTSPSYEVAVGRKTLQYNNTNGLVKNPTWDIGLQKTGYISEAGRCLVMQAEVAGRKLIMVFLDSAGKFSRLGDAERVRNWVESARAFGAPKMTAQKGSHG